MSFPFVWHCMMLPHTAYYHSNVLWKKVWEACEIQGVKLLSNMSSYHRDDFRSIMFTQSDVCVVLNFAIRLHKSARDSGAWKKVWGKSCRVMQKVCVRWQRVKVKDTQKKHFMSTNSIFTSHRALTEACFVYYLFMRQGETSRFSVHESFTFRNRICVSVAEGIPPIYLEL